jgi:hypothetical protein
LVGRDKNEPIIKNNKPNEASVKRSESMKVTSKCDEKCAYMFNVYKIQLSRQTGSRNLTGPKTLLEHICSFFVAFF